MIGLFKSLFSKRALKNNCQDEFSSDFSKHVQKAIALLGDSEISLDDKDVLKLFRSQGISKKEANEILLFLPVAFIKQWLPDLKWHDTYKEFITDKKKIERKYSETKSFQFMQEIARLYFLNSPEADTIIRIAGRSAEFHAINELLNDGGKKMEDIQLTQTVIIR